MSAVSPVEMGSWGALRSILEMELAERLDAEGSKGKRGTKEDSVISGTNIWGAGSISFAERGEIEGRASFLW